MSNPYLPVSLRLLGTYIRAHFAWHNHTYLFGLGWWSGRSTSYPRCSPCTQPAALGKTTPSGYVYGIIYGRLRRAHALPRHNNVYTYHNLQLISPNTLSNQKAAIYNTKYIHATTDHVKLITDVWGIACSKQHNWAMVAHAPQQWALICCVAGGASHNWWVQPSRVLFVSGVHQHAACKCVLANCIQLYYEDRWALTQVGFGVSGCLAARRACLIYICHFILINVHVNQWYCKHKNSVLDIGAWFCVLHGNSNPQCNQRWTKQLKCNSLYIWLMPRKICL